MQSHVSYEPRLQIFGVTGNDGEESIEREREIRKGQRKRAVGKRTEKDWQNKIKYSLSTS
jgi:hypothetical protein